MAHQTKQHDPQQLAALIEGCKNGNKRAQFVLFQLFAPKMLAVTTRYAKDQMEAEDSLIIGFTKVFAKIGTFSDTGSFEGWMKKIMVNTAISSFHQHKRHLSTPITEPIANLVIEHAHNIQETDYLLEALRSLPALLGQPFTLFAIEGYSHKEISTMLSISESLSKVRVMRARKLLRERLKAREIRLNRIHHAA